jgi:thiol-disulfide isomerase/thioredoxin
MRAFWWTWALVMAVAAVGFSASGLSAQTKEPARPAGKLIYRDSDGNLISNNEFVDIRMANFHYPDATVVKTHEDGAVEFRLQKVPQEGMHAPEFSVPVIGGPHVTLSTLRGKVVVLNFWFIGCPACRALKPHLNEFKARFADRDDIVFLAITADPEGRVKEYLKKEPFDYLQGTDAADALGMFKFGGYPKNIVISKTGEIVYWRSTIKAWDKFKSVVEGELAK